VNSSRVLAARVDAALFRVRKDGRAVAMLPFVSTVHAAARAGPFRFAFRFASTFAPALTLAAVFACAGCIGSGDDSTFVPGPPDASEAVNSSAVKCFGPSCNSCGDPSTYPCAFAAGAQCEFAPLFCSNGGTCCVDTIFTCAPDGGLPQLCGSQMDPGTGGTVTCPPCAAGP
jgi:hypothetical protein